MGGGDDLFWNDTGGSYEPMLVKGAASTTAAENATKSHDNDELEGKPPVKKKPKLPDAIATKLGTDAVQQVNAFAEEVIDTVKIYDNARRFEKQKEKEKVEKENDKDGEDDDDDDEEENDGRGEFDFVEFYWDNTATTSGGTLKKVSGVHRNGDYPKYRFDTDTMLPAPVIETTRYDDNLQKELEQAIQKLRDTGFVEVDHFLELHKVHLPCFTWVGKEEEISDTELIHTSQIGGYPALYKDEVFPKYCIFCFQIDLKTIPQRMQCMMGSSGLLQLFMPPTGACDIDGDGKFRIIPKQDYNKLVRSTVTSGAMADLCDDSEPKPRRIVGWVERCDYPTSDDCGGRENWEELVLSDKPHDWYGSSNFTLVQKSDDLNLTFDKFGGYGQYCQDEQHGSCDYEPCDYCGGKHLYRHEVFHMVDIPNGGTGRFSYCPMDPQKTFYFSGSCT